MQDMQDLQKLPIVEYYIKALKNYANFKGRATVPEFWWYVLANVIVSIVIGILSSKLQSIYSLAVLFPSLAIGARRLHDIGKSERLLLLLAPSVLAMAISILAALFVFFSPFVAAALFGFAGILGLIQLGCLVPLVYWWVQPTNEQGDKYNV